MFAAFWSSTIGLDLFQSLAATSQSGNDGIHGGSPHEWFGVVVPSGQKLVDGSYEIVDAEEGIAANAFIGQFGKPALN